MGAFALLLLLLSFAAHADLYRWIDPETGSVKLSSMPPSDPRVQAEVVRYNAPAPPKPAAPPPVAGKPAAVAVAPASVPELETRWRSLLTQLSGVTPQDFNKGAEGLRQHMEAYDAVRAELDRQDPAGAARRRAAEQVTLVERLKKHFLGQ